MTVSYTTYNLSDVFSIYVYPAVFHKAICLTTKNRIISEEEVEWRRRSSAADVFLRPSDRPRRTSLAELLKSDAEQSRTRAESDTTTEKCESELPWRRFAGRRAAFAARATDRERPSLTAQVSPKFHSHYLFDTERSGLMICR